MLRRAAHMSLLEPLDRTEDPDHGPTVHFIVLVMGVPMVIWAFPWPSSIGTGSDSGPCQAILACTTMLCFLSELYNVYQWVYRRDPMVLFLHSSPFRLKLIFREESIFPDGGLTVSGDMSLHWRGTLRGICTTLTDASLQFRIKSSKECLWLRFLASASEVISE